MVEIHILDLTTVRPASVDESPPALKIELTQWDLQLLLAGPIQKGLLFRKKIQSEQPADASAMIDCLKASLSRALDFFPPIAGRFTAEKNSDDGTTTFSVNCNAAGVEFVHAVVDDISVSDLLEQVYIPKIVQSFFPFKGLRNHESVSKPLFGVQITELVDGFFMGFTMNHMMGDGTSFWHFINSWSELSRGSESITKLPNFIRWFPDETKVSIQIPSSWEDHAKLSNNNISKTSNVPQLQERIFHFSKRNIAQLKAKANEETETKDQISSLQSVLAHLWRSVTRCREIDANEDVVLLVAVGARQRLQSCLPVGYFGNAAYFTQITITAGELLKNSLGWAAIQIHKVVVEQTQKEITNWCENWLKEPKFLNTRELFTRNRLTITSSPRFNMYGNDFGWGKPIAVWSGAANKSDGKVTLYCGAAEDGSIDIEICLTAETADRLERDKEFTDALTNTDDV